MSSRTSVCILQVLALCLVASACATTTTVTTSLPHQKVVVDDVDLGPIGKAGLAVAIKPGPTPVPWRLIGAGDVVVAEGSLARTEPRMGVVVGAVAAAACCVPAAAGLGFCVANPALLAGTITCLAAGPGAIIAAAQAPGWATIPLTCVSSAVGTSPLLLGLIGAAPPVEVRLESNEQPPPTKAALAPSTLEVLW